jgi:formylglycine-generating enzyme required for sulfatase activity
VRTALEKYLTRIATGIYLSVTISAAQLPSAAKLPVIPAGSLSNPGSSPIPTGSFIMGSLRGEVDEQPERTVALAGFFMTSHEITEAAYEACVAAGRCTPAHYDDSTCRAWNGRTFIQVRVPPAFRSPRFPVVCVTWHQARQYCTVNSMTLPTEAQWEYAARAGTLTRYPWGDVVPSGDKCIIEKKNGPNNVGSCPANRWGLYDMIGNAWEWANDYYDPEEYRVGLKENPPGPQAGLYRVIRGSGWYGTPNNATVTNRQWFSPDYGEVSIGFRCVKKNY